jgi:hypothetical protein
MGSEMVRKETMQKLLDRVAGEETAVELLANGSQWTDEMARYALPILLWAAKNHRTITYKQLAEELMLRTGEPIKRRMTLYGRPPGKVGVALIRLAEETGWEIPPLNAIVVNAITGLPGDGATSFITRMLSPDSCSNLTKNDSKALAGVALEAVRNYSDWDNVAHALGVQELPPVEVLQTSTPENAPIKRPPYEKNGAYPESEKHKALKRWAVAHPEFFKKYGVFSEGKNEVRLESGDSLDAYLQNAHTRLAIEVKASNAPDSEVFRGIFQCVKYRATLQAMQLADSLVPNANAVLLITRNTSAEAKRLAKRLSVDILRSPVGADG